MNSGTGNGRTFSRFVLEKISEAGEIALDGLFPQNRIEGRIWRKILGLPGSYNFSRLNFSAVLSRLNKQGLVSKSGGRRRSVWLLTLKGQEKLKSFITEPVKPDGIPRLVIYDIPESDRWKRNKVRHKLVAYSYQQLQKSVWIGYCPLPKEFLQLWNDWKLNGKIHILSIDKKGTLEIF
ncbi:MAG: CRISPR-associated endonuclease Cas2 [Patescibacteria group bacterium]